MPKLPCTRKAKHYQFLLTLTKLISLYPLLTPNTLMSMPLITPYSSTLMNKQLSTPQPPDDHAGSHPTLQHHDDHSGNHPTLHQHDEHAANHSYCMIMQLNNPKYSTLMNMQLVTLHPHSTTSEDLHHPAEAAHPIAGPTPPHPLTQVDQELCPKIIWTQVELLCI